MWINLRDRVPHPYALEDAERFLAMACAAVPRTAFAIDVDGVAVGCIGLELHGDIERVSAEIGYWLGVAYWGRGIATAAVRAVTRTRSTVSRQTRNHVTRLEKIFKKLGGTPKGKKCKAMEGLLAEGKELMAEDADAAVMDAALIGAAQRVEHYEMAGYGCVRTYARLLGHNDAADLLQKTLDEEGATDKALTELAEKPSTSAPTTPTSR